MLVYSTLYFLTSFRPLHDNLVACEFVGSVVDGRCVLCSKLHMPYSGWIRVDLHVVTG